jgi:hypothetical protein
MGTKAQKFEDVHILPAKMFLRKLWSGELD